MGKKKINIALDGYSSCGKSTLAKQLAKELKYVYVDTGAMYRAVTLYCLNHGIIDEDNFPEEKVIEALENINISFNFNRTTGKSETFLNGINVELDIRNLRIARFVSPIAAVKEVREKLVAFQQEIGGNKGVVMDGRDIGTTVLPKADLKIFMTASTDVRAYRRYKELLAKNTINDLTLEEVKTSLLRRDEIDTTREVSPLKKAEDAIILDNSVMTIEEQFDIVKNWAVERM